MVITLILQSQSHSRTESGCDTRGSSRGIHLSCRRIAATRESLLRSQRFSSESPISNDVDFTVISFVSKHDLICWQHAFTRTMDDISPQSKVFIEYGWKKMYSIQK